MADAVSPPGLQAPLPWQVEVWVRLRSSLEKGRLHHGILFGGPAGTGKRLLAEHLAASVLCIRREAGEPCGSCRSCVLLRAGTHPDLLRIAPEEPGKQIRISQIRNELAEFVMRTASVAQSKVIMIDPADAMNHSTANCLLKSLEEPAPATHLLLVSDAPARLLATVRSRCEQLRLLPPPREEGTQWLATASSEVDAADALEIGGGCPLKALAMLSGDSIGQFGRVAALMRRASDGAAWIPVLVTEHNDLELRALLDWVYVFLLDFARGLATGNPADWRLQRTLAQYQALGERSSGQMVARMLQRTIEARRDVASTANPNRQLLLESLLVEWQRGFVD